MNFQVNFRNIVVFLNFPVDFHYFDVNQSKEEMVNFHDFQVNFQNGEFLCQKS